MFPESTILNYLFWMIMGILQVAVVAGAYDWLRHYGRKVKWWQMLLLYSGFASICLVVAAGFTLAGEFESRAGYYFIGFFGTLVLVALAVLVRLFIVPRKKAA